MRSEFGSAIVRGDEDEAAMTIGDLYCRVAINRLEVRWSFKSMPRPT